jgi:aryl-alcohol dehydrogenase-like predicted oxidoreductase
VASAKFGAPTSRDEAVATVSEAVEAAITFLDVALAYGKGEAELVIELGR